MVDLPQLAPSQLTGVLEDEISLSVLDEADREPGEAVALGGHQVEDQD